MLWTLTQGHDLQAIILPIRYTVNSCAVSYITTQLSTLWWWFFPCVQGCSTIHSPPVLFFPFFFKVEVRSCTLIPLFRPGSVRSGSESWDNCDCEFPDKLHVSLCPDKFPHYAWTAAESAHSNFIESRVYVCSGVSCHLYFWQIGQGLLCATAVTQGWNVHRIKVSTQS